MASSERYGLSSIMLARRLSHGSLPKRATLFGVTGGAGASRRPTQRGLVLPPAFRSVLSRTNLPERGTFSELLLSP